MENHFQKYHFYKNQRGSLEAQKAARASLDRRAAYYNSPRWFQAQNFCFTCYRPGHREPCANKTLPTCSNCFRCNIFTRDCFCQHPEKLKSRLYGENQVFRLVGDKASQSMYIDVVIVFKLFEAKISTGQSVTSVNKDIFNWVISLMHLVNDNVESDRSSLNIPIELRGKSTRLDCVVIENQEEPIILGMDFLSKQGFSMTFDGVTLTEKTIALPHQREKQYFYNLPQGSDLRRYLLRHGGDIKPSSRYGIPNWPPVVKQKDPQDDYLQVDLDSSDMDL